MGKLSTKFHRLSLAAERRLCREPRWISIEEGYRAGRRLLERALDVRNLEVAAVNVSQLKSQVGPACCKTGRTGRASRKLPRANLDWR